MTQNYNKFMQDQELKSFELEKCVSNFSLLDDIFDSQEKKMNLILEQRDLNSCSIKVNNPLRGKGRPKGYKNSKETSKKTKNSSNDQNRRKGHWSLEENKKYHWFLEIYHTHFICKEMRRLDKIFKTMANFIGTRQAQQCRSHHQKMQKKYHSFSNILLFLRQSHYQTDQTAPILQDMNRNDVKEIAVLLDPRDLQTMDTPKTSASLPFIDQEKGNELIEISKFIDFRDVQFNAFDDILGDNYELRLDLDNLLM